MIRRPPRSTPLYSSAASDVYKRQRIRSTTRRAFCGETRMYLASALASIKPLCVVGCESWSLDHPAHVPPSYNLRPTILLRRLGRLLGRSPGLSLIHISEPTRQAEISYAVFCLKKKKKKSKNRQKRN